MKQKFFFALLLTGIIALSCKSRFSSTADASGPREHIYADPVKVKDTVTIKNSEPNITEIRDSASTIPIISPADSISALSD